MAVFNLLMSLFRLEVLSVSRSSVGKSDVALYRAIEDAPKIQLATGVPQKVTKLTARLLTWP